MSIATFSICLMKHTSTGTPPARPAPTGVTLCADAGCSSTVACTGPKVTVDDTEITCTMAEGLPIGTDVTVAMYDGTLTSGATGAGDGWVPRRTGDGRRSREGAGDGQRSRGLATGPWTGGGHGAGDGQAPAAGWDVIVGTRVSEASEADENGGVRALPLVAHRQCPLGFGHILT